MKTSETNRNGNRLVLSERYNTVAGKRFLYRLYAAAECNHAPRFYVAVSGDGEYSEGCIPTDLTDAARIHDAIASGGVTPCTLDEVLSDLLFNACLVNNG